MTTLYTNFRWAFTGELQAMLVEDGRVLRRGPMAQIAEMRSGVVEDLGGNLLAPAFIDAHCHILPTGLDLQKLNLSECGSPEAVLEAVAARHRELEPGEWLLAVHYDQTKYPGGTHLHRNQLDAISKDRPILLRHSNGHASVANTATLERAQVTRDTPNPKGGEFVRDREGELTGVLLEHAHERVTSAAPSPTLEQMVDAILAAGAKMADLGIIAATDMMTGRYNLRRELEAYRIAGERGCAIQTRLCIQWAERHGPRASHVEDLIEALDPATCRVWGTKIFADGAIGSATAKISGSYVSQPGTDGQLIYAPDRLKKMVQVAHDAGERIAIHSIGDAATDLVMDAYEALDEPSRHRIEHAMILSDPQIERMAKLGIHCTMQPEFLIRFGHSYKHHLGPERASRLKRFRSVKDAGIPLSFSSDRPIVPGDPATGVRCGCSRPAGFDPAENLTWEESLEAYTHMGAVANNDDDMGNLEPGQPARFMIVGREV